MKNDPEDKSADIKNLEQDRRTELAMLGLSIEKYPREEKEKTQKLLRPSERLSS